MKILLLMILCLNLSAFAQDDEDEEPTPYLGSEEVVREPTDAPDENADLEGNEAPRPKNPDNLKTETEDN